MVLNAERSPTERQRRKRDFSSTSDPPDGVGIFRKFRERFFLFDRARPFFFFDKTKKKNGGAIRPPVLPGGAQNHAETKADRPGGRSLHSGTSVVPTGRTSEYERTWSQREGQAPPLQIKMGLVPSKSYEEPLRKIAEVRA